MLLLKDTLEPWKGEALPRSTDEAELRYHDGRREIVKVEPYTFLLRHPANIETAWTEAELDEAGFVKPVLFEPPPGKVAIGPSRYERQPDGRVVEVRDVEDVPEPTVVITKYEYDRLKALDTPGRAEERP